jgi:hypothetical protein
VISAGVGQVEEAVLAEVVGAAALFDGADVLDELQPARSNANKKAIAREPWRRRVGESNDMRPELSEESIGRMLGFSWIMIKRLGTMKSAFPFGSLVRRQVQDCCTTGGRTACYRWLALRQTRTERKFTQ